VSCLLLQPNAVNADENSFGYRIFGIQKKLALKGSTLAQYKLGTFYEFGISVKPNPTEAMLWYKKSSAKGNKAAANRIVFLEMKQKGLDSKSQSEWLSKIKVEAASGNVHSIIILGQLYHHGLAVNKNLNKAVELLNKASMRGHTEVDAEIDEINALISPEQATQSEPVVKKDKIKKNQIIAALPDKAVKTKKVKSKPANKKSKKQTKEESRESKRQRYEEAIRKQQQESQLLDDQQNWSESEE
jgi:TPR repeat protein